MKGKKGDKGKKGYGKRKYGKSFGKYDKSNEYSKNNEYGKGSEKRKRKKGRKAKDREKTRSQRHIRVSSRATAGHVARGSTRRVSLGKVMCKPWRKFRVLLPDQWRRVQRPHLLAAKTAASIQEINDENEPGWIFGVMGGSVSSVTTGTDDLWDELVVVSVDQENVILR